MKEQQPSTMTTNSDSNKEKEPVAAAAVEEESWDYHQKDEQDWALTYNIWHMLPWMERKQMANKYGCKTIGEFEEFMSMKRALEEENGSSNEKKQQKPYPNEQAYPFLMKENKSQDDDNNDKKPAAKTTTIQEDDEDDDAENDSLTVSESNNNNNTTTPDTFQLSDEELLKVGGLFLTLPDELCHHIFAHLSVETYATLALVSPHWQHLTRTERVYQRLCERIYLQQSKRRALHVSRFGNSHRRMLYSRPRVRNGLYVMKYSKVKKIQRDMWCEIPVGAILETVYYRYIQFFENGTVLYALTTAHPHVMIRRFLKVLTSGSRDKSAVWGTFHVQGKRVVVKAQQEWQHVQLHMSILADESSPDHYGRFGSLTFDKHLTSASGNFDEYAWPNDIHEFEVPNQYFNYVPDRRLN